MTTTEQQTPGSTGRFEVSESGMRELNSGREPWHLVKELIQNAWDEAPYATECRVTVEPQPEGDATLVIVQDDGPGFANITDAYTLMGPTDKRLQPTKRGRFNLGEKDVISVAIEAEVETVGHTVKFPRTGSRERAVNSRARGTVVKALMPWNKEQSDQLVARLVRFIPPVDCSLIVNDFEVLPRPAMEIRSATLQTETQYAPGEPLRTSPRPTKIHFLEPHQDANGEGWLYEMGIPVRAADCPWDIDVMQKIPMPQQRNAVSEAYLNRVYAEALNATHGRLEADEFASQWVKRAIEHFRVTPEAIKSTVKGRYGSYKAVFSTLDSDANNRASYNGYAVINPGGLSKREIKAFRRHAGVRDSDEVFPPPKPPDIDYPPPPGSNQERFAEWVTEMSRHCNLSVTVRFFNEPRNERQADCEVSTETPTLRFNEGSLGQTFFEPPYESIKHWNLLLHELGHALTERPSAGHGEAWGEGVSKAGALIAVNINLDRAE